MLCAISLMGITKPIEKVAFGQFIIEHLKFLCQNESACVHQLSIEYFDVEFYNHKISNGLLKKKQEIKC